MVNILCEKVVQRKHVGFFGSEKDVVREVLYDLGNQEQSSSHLLGWWSADQALRLWRDDGGAEEPKKDEGSDRGVFGFQEAWHYGSRDLLTVQCMYRKETRACSTHDAANAAERIRDTCCRGTDVVNKHLGDYL